MREPFDVDEFIHHASQPGATAPYVKEAMGLTYSESYVNRLMKKYVGTRPTHASISRPPVWRVALVAYMEGKNKLDRRYCSKCGRYGVRECAIHADRPDLDSFVFVCVGRCAGPGDF